MSIFEDLGRRLKGWPLLFIGPGVAALLGFLFLRLKTVTVPDWIILALIVGLWLAVLYVFWYIRHSEKKTDGSAKSIKPSKEVLFILGTLAKHSGPYVNRGGLQTVYEKAFREKEGDEFTAVIGALHGSDLIRYYAYDSNDLQITDEGGAYYLKHKERPKKAKKK